MSARVQFEDEADVEYRQAGRWYESHRSNLGFEFFDAVDATINQILAMPNAGERVPRASIELSVRRRAVKRFPYHVIYLDAGSVIRILAVAHDRQKPGYWKSRLSS